MADGRTGGTTQFLTVEEAAQKLGQSRLRVREAVARGLLKARRDNEGRLRVDLPEGSVPEGQGALDPDDVLGFLFDDIEELETTRQEQEARLTALTMLVEGQDAALERAGQALDKAEADRDRLSALLDRALAHLEAADETRMAGLTDRALTRLEAVGDQLGDSLSQTQRFDALLERAVAVAEDGRPSEAFQQATDRALALLESALGRAEAGDAVAERSTDMLDRALRAAEHVQSELSAQTERLNHQTETLETALTMSERAAALAEKASSQPEKRGFFRRLFGI